MSNTKSPTRILATWCALLSSCSAAGGPAQVETPQAPEASLSATTSSEQAISTPTVEAAVSLNSAPATVVADPPNSTPTRSSSCPDDMTLVAGDYCSDVRHTCKKEWFSEANKKRVCEEFEPHSECVGTKTSKRFCIDKYSWPNIVGARPEVMNNFYQAQVKCAAVGKRLCTESEWTMSCEGPEMLPFPYGYVRDTTKCNGDREWDNPDMVKVAERDPEELARLWQGVPNGGQPECVSGYGVYDLAGNTDDVVQSETTTSGYKGKFDSVHTGGPWYKGVRNQCRPKIYTHDEGFYYYFLGFRCCAEPDGIPTDPRGPKQIARGWDMARIERMARFTREDIKQKLRQKTEGKCECKDTDTLCKTMCGSLLGPKAKDVVLQRPKP
jgi:formylglycine-generating enzyme